jgi:hypothetical protein
MYYCTSDEFIANWLDKKNLIIGRPEIFRISSLLNYDIVYDILKFQNITMLGIMIC